MKKLLVASLVYSMMLSGLAVYLYANQPAPINKTVTYEIVGRTPVKNVDYFDGRDGKTLPAIPPENPKDPQNGVDGKDAIPAKPCTTYNDENGDMVQECPDGSRSVLKQPLNGTDGFTPTVQCNLLTGKFKIQYNPEELFQDISNSKCVV